MAEEELKKNIVEIWLPHSMDLSLNFDYDIPIYQYIVKWLHTKEYKEPFEKNRYLRIFFVLSQNDDTFVKAYTLPAGCLKYPDQNRLVSDIFKAGRKPLEICIQLPNGGGSGFYFSYDDNFQLQYEEPKITENRSDAMLCREPSTI